MNQIKVLFKQYAKTVVAFLAAWLGNALFDLVNGTSPWPQTKAEWTQYVLTSLVAALGVGLTRNKITQSQLDKDPNVVGGVVVPDAQIPAAVAPVINPTTGGEYRNPWQ